MESGSGMEMMQLITQSYVKLITDQCLTDNNNWNLEYLLKEVSFVASALLSVCLSRIMNDLLFFCDF